MVLQLIGLSKFVKIWIFHWLLMGMILHNDNKKMWEL
jgi:hypothetical protein